MVAEQQSPAVKGPVENRGEQMVAAIRNSRDVEISGTLENRASGGATLGNRGMKEPDEDGPGEP